MCFKTQRCWVFKPEKNRKQENITRSQWQLEVKIYVTNFKVQENELSGRFLVWLCIHFVERVVQDFPDQSSIALSQTKLESWIKFNNQVNYSKKRDSKVIWDSFGVPSLYFIIVVENLHQVFNQTDHQVKLIVTFVPFLHFTYSTSCYFQFLVKFLFVLRGHSDYFAL